MLNVDIAGSSVKSFIKSDTPLLVCELRQQIEEATRLSHDQYYIIYKGRLVQEGDICSNGQATVVPRLLGGKGGFGSMLRAIGAQIEKTTNREACRDLSGRRLRDINEEKRLKAWIEKQAKREKEAAERKKKKLEKLSIVPRHEFKDQRYEQERADLTERVGDAVEEGFKAAGTSGIKRKLEEDIKPKKRKTMLDLEVDSDEFEDTSDDSDRDDILPTEKCKTDQSTSNDNGHSIEDTGKVTKKIESKHLELSTDNQINDKVSNNDSADIKCNVDFTKSPGNQSANFEEKTAVK